MTTITGRWHGCGMQAILGQSPYRSYSPGRIGDLVISPDGSLYTEKKAAFGKIIRFDYRYEYDTSSNSWLVFSSDDGSYCAELFFLDGKLVWQYAKGTPLGLSETCLFFVKG